MKRLLMLSLAASIGCADTGGAPEKVAARPSVTTEEAQALFVPEPAATGAEFTIDARTWRLFGVQLGDRRTAVFADTRTWRTREVRVGELLTRNLRLEDLNEEAVVLVEPDGTAHVVDVGEDVRLSEIRHFLDEAVSYEGRGRYKVDVPKFELLRSRYGIGADTERVQVPGLFGLQIVRLNDAGILARMGLQEQDILLEHRRVQGIVDRISRGEPVQLRVYRRGNLLLLDYHS